jgi:hypothetical protein
MTKQFDNIGHKFTINNSYTQLLYSPHEFMKCYCIVVAPFAGQTIFVIDVTDNYNDIVSIYDSTAFCGPWPLFQLLNLYTVSRTPWLGNQPVARPLPTRRINVHRHPCLELDSNPRFRVRAGEDSSCLRPERAVTVIGTTSHQSCKIPQTILKQINANRTI